MSSPNWTFLSNHAHVLICLSQNSEQPLREVALSVGITERAVQRIVGELVDAGFLERERVGRQNAYRIHGELRLRHPLEERTTIGQLLKLITHENSVVVNP